jgi:hypothetical protein
METPVKIPGLKESSQANYLMASEIVADLKKLEEEKA